MPELASLWNPSAMDQTCHHDLFATTFVAAGFENEEERRRVNVLATAYLVALVTDLALAHPSAGLPRRPWSRRGAIRSGAPLLTALARARGGIGRGGRGIPRRLAGRRARDLRAAPPRARRLPLSHRARHLCGMGRGAGAGRPRHRRCGARHPAGGRAHPGEGPPHPGPEGGSGPHYPAVPARGSGRGQTHYCCRASGRSTKTRRRRTSGGWRNRTARTRQWRTITRHAPFVCALAGQHLCAAAEPACATGWPTLSTLPAREGCSTRRQLDAASLPLV